jgi:transcriptional regulator with PAS, ATPase and Fis domain
MTPEQTSVDYTEISPQEVKLTMKRQIPFSLVQEMRTFEIRIINRVLRHTHNNQTLAAELMAMSRRTLVYRLNELPEIVIPHPDNEPAFLSLEERLERFELEQVQNELNYTQNNRELAAMRLRISLRRLNAILARTDKAVVPRSPIAPSRVGLRKFVLWQLMDSFEKKLILQTIELCGDDKKQAAIMMGLPRRTLYWKMKKLGIDC